ncbi:16S rRNA (cytidine(1402)-2'-O)-methyltransferase [Lactococcus lactis subsp. cremoris]|uniref:Ribosomal RNA small subunit methyltransferase I n=1 Tax=Lactococcus lactis subsp. cremoris TaxID=1359 RepID=A0AAJ6MHA3_LACLC|nr:16S rRNA (cytidine(1402)-2'-O)-methyltransferase [Lactococcus cremoris]ARD90731.1 16S rRNA (cytidine(1402)-2'-O)-methyltransferase [Lactococcus cremoris]MRM69015.1 16S rRNA (cytidine(1402)-2'-O)-methyltransferase [Lactococcus cremoris]QJD19387.1 16S rRNA (cytidine(1402)-2'-O)-methyltransferase [Lactococcus cremoris]QRZ29231.1 methyltransferase [Lactococcus cremoris]UXV59015.1 16S rRNA (cytidine(1402)-2'-O)-methyltransferase [Lactococcus cremoris]
MENKFNIQRSFKGVKTAGSLYLVPTPIGNMQDMTLRSLETLKTVDLICSEDTRNTLRLLNHFEIKVPQESFHEHNSQEKIPKLIDFLKSGQSIAQVSDAGMPSISDPGHDLVLAAIKEEIDVVALPGASAGITALIASGLVPQPHIFYGFLPRKKGEQQKFLKTKLAYPETQIFYESPFRVADTLSNMQEIYGDREVVLVRELTKIYEEYRRGKISEVLNSLVEQPIKGECLIIVSGADELVQEIQGPELTALEAVKNLVAQNVKPNVAIKEIAKERGLNRQDLYAEFHDL